MWAPPNPKSEARNPKQIQDANFKIRTLKLQKQHRPRKAGKPENGRAERKMTSEMRLTRRGLRDTRYETCDEARTTTCFVLPCSPLLALGSQLSLTPST